LKSLSIFIIAGCLAVQTFSVHANKQVELYRYKDKSGQLVVDNILPPEFANSGYEIISERGNVLETIPPKRTKAEIIEEKEAIALQKKAEETEKKRQAELAEEKRKDDVLLMSYSTEKDIEISRDSKLSAIEVLENITKDHVQQLTKQLDEARSAAANYERMGRSLPENILKTIDESKRQIQENETFLTTKSEEKERIIREFERDLNRYKTLKAKVTQGSINKKPILSE
jgi:hypothetical protein